MAIDRASALARAERAYEIGRARRAATLSVPLLAFAVVAVCLGARPLAACCVGVMLLGVAWFCLWRGQTLGRAVFPGVVAGLVPLALAVGAQSCGHVCTGTQCVSLCIPACTIGGVVAGLLIARSSRHVSSRGAFLAGASAIAILVGSLGCACVGYGGVAGLAVGLAFTLVPASLIPQRAPG